MLFVGSCLNSQNLIAKQNQLSAQNGLQGVALKKLGKMGVLANIIYVSGVL